MRQTTYGHDFQSLYLWLCCCRITNTSSLSTEISSRRNYGVPFACEIYHSLILSKFTYAFYRTMFDAF